MLLSLLPVFAGAAAGLALIKMAVRRWQIGICQVRTVTLARGSGALVLAVGLFALAMSSLWLGAFASLHLMSDL
jgi:hypothetical protein